jgi:signal transduction histidine kinase
LFINIGDEIAVALRASQNHRRVLELQSVQAAMAERRLVSAYVHDQLGQDLGYLHLKLDQLGKDKSIRKSKELQVQLNQLQSVANESYEKVRDILRKIQPETIPHLTNVLQEHARRISQRAKFSLHFRSTGSPVNLSPAAQHMIFSIFYETFNNIEKHARANNVDVAVVWQDRCLDISISDNGVGFESGTAREEDHFGLTILHERIAKLNGTLAIDSSTASGTMVSISIPLNQTGEIIQ